MLSMLTGIGYDTSRNVPCLVPTCEYRFFMDRDLKRHLRAEHSLPDAEIEEKIALRDALSGGQFWIGGLDDAGFADNLDSVDPSMPQTPAVPYYVDGEMKAVDPSLDFFTSGGGFEDEEMMDREMGLVDLGPAMDISEGLGVGVQWDMLAPVGQFNMEHE
jgi:hypothetical protein